MKLLIYLLTFFLCFSSVAQKKKQIKKYKLRCVSTTITAGTKTINDNKTLYNANGDLITEINYDSLGTLKNITQFKYANNEVVEEIKYDGKNAVLEKKIYKYNGLGEKTSETVKDKDNRIVKRIDYSYNDKGLKSEKRTYDAANKLISTKKYNYNCK